MNDVLHALTRPISAACPEGQFDEDDALFVSIDMEMVKLGGLQAQTLDWAMAEQASAQYLQERCKHFRIVGHLANAWLRDQQWEGWIRAVQLVAGMVQGYWTSAYPRSGANVRAARQRQFAAWGERLQQALTHLQPGGFSDEVGARAKAAVAALARAEQLHGIVPSVADCLAPALQRGTASAKRAPFDAARPERTVPVQRGSDPVVADFFTTRSDAPLGNANETRSLYLKLADYINQQDAYEPTGYLLRRHALWSGILSTPPVKREHRTELMCVPTDISSGYQEAVAGNAISPTLLLRIEKSLASSPYWLRGSFLAAEVAQRLEMPMVALVITLAAERFVRRLPTLRELGFSDGTPFIDDEVFAWLSSAGPSLARAPAAGGFALQHGTPGAPPDPGEGVDAVLQRLQAGQGAHTPPRERHYASAAAADALAARGVSWLARDLYAGVAQAMCQQTASQWEPDLFQHVSARSAQPKP